MKATELQAFKTLLTQALAFYRQDVSEFTLTVWWQACEQFDIEQVRKALTAHAMDPERGRFPPMPADMVRELVGTKTDRSLLAWGKVHQAFAAVGMYGSPKFDAAISSAITDMGGWPKLCQATTDELPFLQKRFCDLHRAYTNRPEEAHTDRLIGLHEQTNQALGREQSQALGMAEEVRRIA